MTKLEEVARAIFADLLPGHIWDDAVPDTKALYRQIARAAIQAMREPTDSMFEAAIRATGEQANFVVAHCAMIDQVLSEGK